MSNGSLRDFTAAATFKLDHRLGQHNAVQKVFYLGASFAMLMMLLSGLAIWKPVQFAPMTAPFGGFQGARLVHFVFMSAIALFVAVHVALVILVPKTRERPRRRRHKEVVRHGSGPGKGLWLSTVH